MWGRGQRNKVMKYGEGPGESVVHEPRASSLYATSAKIDFPIGYFMLPLLMLTLEV